jgi:hypothetical protein
MMRVNRQSPAGRANFRFLISLLLNLAIAIFVLSDLKGARDLILGAESEDLTAEVASSGRPDRSETAVSVLKPRACKPCEFTPALCAEIG